MGGTFNNKDDLEGSTIEDQLSDHTYKDLYAAPAMQGCVFSPNLFDSYIKFIF